MKITHKKERSFEDIKKDCPFCETDEGWKDGKLDWSLDNCTLLLVLKKGRCCSPEACPAIRLFKAFGLS